MFESDQRQHGMMKDGLDKTKPNILNNMTCSIEVQALHMRSYFWAAVILDGLGVSNNHFIQENWQKCMHLEYITFFSGI